VTPPERTLDKYDLYEMAAQSPRIQARFLRALHYREHNDNALVLGEDFAGTGAISRAWVESFEGASSVCVDHDAEPMQRADGIAGIRRRCCDVRKASDEVDLLCTLNFSICELHSRSDLVAYLEHALSRIRPGGVFVADLYGGSDAFAEGESETVLRESDSGVVQYMWEQRYAAPLTGRVVNAMHFRVGEGEWMRDAFVYDWRLWSPVELRDAMLDAGFGSVEFYDRLGDAIDEDGSIHALPLDDDEPIDENFVVFVAARPKT
jgi:hypothetical protein